LQQLTRPATPPIEAKTEKEGEMADKPRSFQEIIRPMCSRHAGQQMGATAKTRTGCSTTINTKC